MRIKYSLSQLILVLALTPALPVQADLLSWGLDPANGDWTASQGTQIFFEDWTGGGGGYVSPGWGGQHFDVEAMYAVHNGDSVDYAIITGFDLDGVEWSGDLYTPGDLFFDVDGSANGENWDVAVDLQTGDLYENATGSIPTFGSSAPFTITGGDLIGSSTLSYDSDGALTIAAGNMHSNHYDLDNYCGGSDETRTRDLRRDRPAF